MLLAVVLEFVLFFKQKTAYERRISDWSSDVCSSDLKAERDGLSERFKSAVTDLAAEAEARKAADIRLAALLSEQKARDAAHEIGRASWRERWCQYVSISVVAVSSHTKLHHI